MNYNDTWGWSEQSTKGRAPNNTIAPLGGSNEQAPGALVLPPSQQEQAARGALQQFATKSIGSGVDKAVDAYKTADAAQAAKTAADAAMAADAVGGATDLVGGAAGEAASSFGGPLAAAAGGLMKGEYDEAAGAAVGAMLGSYFGPLGTFAGSKVGGMAGNAAGDLLGFNCGTTNVKGYADGTTGAGGKGGSSTGSPSFSAPSGMANTQIGTTSPKVGEPMGGFQGKGPSSQVTPTSYYGELNQAYDPFQAGNRKLANTNPGFYNNQGNAVSPYSGNVIAQGGPAGTQPAQPAPQNVFQRLAMRALNQ